VLNEAHQGVLTCVTEGLEAPGEGVNTSLGLLAVLLGFRRSILSYLGADIVK